MAPRSGFAAGALVAGLLVAACSGGSDDAASDTTAAPDASVGDTASSEPPATEPAADEAPTTDGDSTDEDVSDDGSAELESGTSFVPGDIEYRAVNLTDVPVDVYVRTSGVIEAFLVEEAFAPGAVSDFVAPPDGQGRFLITTAGAGDATCVVDCDHFVTELIAFPDEGPVRTVLVYPGDAGDPEAFEFWELPTVDAPVSGNAMVAADPSMALAAVSAVAIVEPDFGYRVSNDLTEGCLADVNDSDLLIGGNQVIPYDFGFTTEFTLHAFEDQDCSQDPVGGPFPFEGDLGSRYHVMLHGTPGALEALVLPMVDDSSGTGAASVGEDVGADASADASAGRDEAIGLMATEVTATFGLGDPEATCVATLVVDRIGPDVLVVDGELVDLDSFPDDINQLAGEALVASVAECGIDPSVYG